MKTLKLKNENTKAYKLGYELGYKAINPYEGSDNKIEAFRFHAGQRQHKRERNEREGTN